jgi:hypothetical protein
VASRSEWRFEPLPGNPDTARRVRPPLYAGDDPFELSEQELQSILGNATLGDATPDAKTGRGTPGASPFGDVHEPRRKKSPFLDDLAGDD